MKPYRCLIVDDEELARRLVASYCERLPHLDVIGQVANPLQAMEYLRQDSIDILFLDIQMPEMKGTDLLRIVRNLPAVILTTAYSDYALEGYELNVTDYLLKPFSFERFVQAIHKVDRHLSKRAATPNAPAPADSHSASTMTAPTADPTHHIVRADHKVHRFAFADIIYIEGAREYVIYHTTGSKTMALDSLKRLERVLPTGFIRVHKSYIVAKDKVTHMEGNQLYLGENIMLPIGGSYRADVVKSLFPG